ncbi:PF04237 family protein [Leptospira weilii serovar Ranarum str. ICFT]|uniref:PF04237 family protein n=1 Tax=Leptospira weilii serovar Ranarum str. ICFT TaxID=1218598 RepID=N1WGC5_9LEPT|nr:MmcQ/YjbR family DNA-binding protein [Leptospira weilii]EMY77975.1 PF04237 family protein [Leptospira weilii serovar Ranarum str. ICFT]
MNHPNDIPEEILSKLRLLCFDFPEVYEERAWVGTRWCVKKKNFAHILMLREGWPPAYAQAVGMNGPAYLLTFRFSLHKIDTSRFTQYPFFNPVWWPNIAGLVIDDKVDWEEVNELLIQSYCEIAPKKLAALVKGR